MNLQRVQYALGAYAADKLGDRSAQVLVKDEVVRRPSRSSDDEFLRAAVLMLEPDSAPARRGPKEEVIDAEVDMVA